MLSDKERELAAVFAEEYPAGHGREYFVGSGVEMADEAADALKRRPELLARG